MSRIGQQTVKRSLAAEGEVPTIMKLQIRIRLNTFGVQSLNCDHSRAGNVCHDCTHRNSWQSNRNFWLKSSKPGPVCAELMRISLFELCMLCSDWETRIELGVYTIDWPCTRSLWQFLFFRKMFTHVPITILLSGGDALSLMMISPKYIGFNYNSQENNNLS